MKKLPSIYLGTEISYSPPRLLKAGSLQCMYHAGSIRYVRAGGLELIRMIYPAVRDRNWGTVAGQILSEEISTGKDSFDTRYECRYTSGEIDYLARYRITGGSDNTLTFSMHGEAVSGFEKNRIGLNVLHPVKECTGKPCRVTTPSGEQYDAVFPVEISPHQPMKNIRSMNWTLDGGITAFLEYSGDVFEMEDQRNWTDASYKTYCTPLELPFPVSINKGDTLKQEVYLRIEGDEIRDLPDEENRVILPEKRSVRKFPEIGLEKSSEVSPLSKTDQNLIREAGFRHSRLDLHLYRENWRKTFEADLMEAISLELPLELALFFGSDYRGQAAAFLSEMSRYPVPLRRAMVFTEDHLNDGDVSGYVIPLLKKEYPEARIGTGTNANFTELNRNRPEPGLADFLAYSINPQVHAYDPLSLVENLEAQAETVRTAISFAGNSSICISPVTLRPRFNVVATSMEREERKPALPFSVDPRQTSLFCAGWTLGSFKYLAEAGAESITYYETAGRRGIIHGDQPPLTPEYFLSREGDIYPVYFLFRELLKYRDYKTGATNSSHPCRFSCLLLEGRNDRVLILANHTPVPQKINLPEGMIGNGSWTLDEYSIERLRKAEDIWKSERPDSPVSLNPYAVTFLRTGKP